MRCLFRRSSAVVWTVCLFVVSLLTSPLPGLAAERGSLHGTVSDPLGAVVAGAKVELLNGTTVVKTTTTDGAGNYAFDVPESARYSVRAVAPTFQSTTSDSVYGTKSTKAELDVTLATQTLTQQVSVTASATPTPIAQIAASATVLTADDYRQYTDVQDPLRQIPGLQVTQVGQLGATTGLSIRGGATGEDKVAVDS